MARANRAIIPLFTKIAVERLAGLCDRRSILHWFSPEFSSESIRFD